MLIRSSKIAASIQQKQKTRPVTVAEFWMGLALVCHNQILEAPGTSDLAQVLGAAVAGQYLLRSDGAPPISSRRIGRATFLQHRIRASIRESELSRPSQLVNGELTF